MSASRAVHPPCAVGEDPVAEQALGHARDLRLGVAGLHADQGEQAGVDRADDLAVDLHAGFGDALDQGEHGAGSTVADAQTLADAAARSDRPARLAR